MSMYGKYPKVQVNGKWVEQNGIDGAPKAWPTTDCSKDKRLTSQAQRDDVDINKIVKKMEMGHLPDIRQDGRFEDVSEFQGLGEAIIKVQEANKLFMELPADIRSRFENKPEKLMEFLDNEENRKEAEELGLLEPKSKDKPADPAPAKPADPAPAQ